MVDHVIDAKVRETQCAVVVVQLQGADTGGISLERQHEDVTHQSHVLDNILRVAVLGARHVRFPKGWSPTLNLTAFAGAFDALLHFADGVQIFVELLLVQPTDVAAQILRVRQHRIEHALVASLRLVLEELIKRQRGINLQRGGCSRTAP